jgi:cytoskeleton protein RodZ
MPTSTTSIEPEEPPRHSIGALLRETRRGLGGDIDRIAASLRIRASFLKAIEESHYDRLPAQVYALGFVRAYAAHLGLDGDEAVRRFKQETVGFEPQRGLSFPVPLAERSIPGGRMLLAALIFALCGYGLWYYVSTGERDRPERVSAVPADLAAAAQATAAPSPASSATDAKAAEPVATAPAPTSASPAAPAAASPAAVATATPMPATAPRLAPAAENPGTGAASAVTAPATAVSPPSPAGAAVAAAPGASVPPAATQGRVYGAEGGVSRIVIEVTKDSWLQIRDGNRVLLDKVLHPGDSYRVGDRSGLVMRTGNAAGLDIEVDGHRTPAIKGTVRNQIALDPDRLVAGTAAAN